MRKEISNNLLAVITGLKPVTIRRIHELGTLREYGKTWSYGQALGVAVKVSCRANGATLEACIYAYRMLAAADIDKLREAVAGGHRYLRLMGSVADSRLVTEAAAFDATLVKVATETRTPYVVADIKYWIERIDAELERSSESDVLFEGAACLKH